MHASHAFSVPTLNTWEMQNNIIILMKMEIIFFQITKNKTYCWFIGFVTLSPSYCYFLFYNKLKKYNLDQIGFTREMSKRKKKKINNANKHLLKYVFYYSRC